MTYKQSGFTLIEVLVAIGILAFMMSIIFVYQSQTIESVDRTQSFDSIYHMGRVAMRKIGDDIHHAFLISPHWMGKENAKYMPSSVETFFIGKDEGEHDSISLTSMSHKRLFRKNRESDQCKIHYEVISSEKLDGLYTLIQKKQPWLDARTEVEGRSLILIDGIKGFNLEYYDVRRRDWIDEWNSASADMNGKLPFAVRIALEFPNPDDDDDNIKMVSAIPLAFAVQEK